MQTALEKRSQWAGGGDTRRFRYSLIPPFPSNADRAKRSQFADRRPGLAAPRAELGSSGFCILPCPLGALPPSPRHLTLWANSMKERCSTALARNQRREYSIRAAAEGRACPIRLPLRASSEPVEGALPASTPPAGVSPRCGRATVQWHRRCRRWRRHRLACTMLLAESAKCQGSGDSVPGLCLRSIQEVRKNRTTQD